MKNKMCVSSPYEDDFIHSIITSSVRRRELRHSAGSISGRPDPYIRSPDFEKVTPVPRSTGNKTKERMKIKF